VTFVAKEQPTIAVYVQIRFVVRTTKDK